MKNKFIGRLLIIAMIAPMLLSCEKVTEEPVKQTKVQERTKTHVYEQKIWPWVIAGVVTVIVSLSEGQATDVQYYENGNLQGYSCTGLGTCHIQMSNSDDGTSIGTTDGLYTTDKMYSGFELVSSNKGDVFLRTGLDNPDKNGVFYDKKEWTLSIPFTIDNPKVMSTLGLKKPLKILGGYEVFEDHSENLTYIKLK